MSHTPGPWRLVCVGDDAERQCPADSMFNSILTIVREGQTSFGAVLNDDDARLIAAAPELLAVLKELLDAPYGLRMFHRLSEQACADLIRDTWMPRIQAVIAKAEGTAS